MGMSEFYGRTDDATSLAVLGRAAELGIGHFDTADLYGDGHNERLLGKAFANADDDVFIATKFGFRKRDGEMLPAIDNSPSYIRAACEASLRRLRRECIDLIY